MIDAMGVFLGHFEPEAGYTTIFETGEPLPLEAANANAVRETAAALPYVREGELPGP